MEIKARYTLIGLFTLAVIALGFGFVYWLNAAGGLSRTTYRIKFEDTVGGLQQGSAVLFNGVRVGEVTGLKLSAADPRQIDVDIAIDKATPVRADTKVGMDFQGLTGAPVVSLTGGTAAMQLAAAPAGTPQPLVAEKNAGQGVTQGARDVLRRLDQILSENAAPFRSLVANLDKFAEALGRNADKVDSIVTGVQRLTGGGPKVIPKVFELAAAGSFPKLGKVPAAQIQVAETTSLGVYDTDKIVIRAGTSDKQSIDAAQWPDLVPKLVQTRIIQSFENAKVTGIIGRAPDGIKTDYQLMLDIRRFDVSGAAGGTGDVEIAAKLVSTEGKIVAARPFKASRPVATALDGAAAAKALSDAFEAVATEIVEWTCAAI